MREPLRIAERVKQHLVVSQADLCSQWLRYFARRP
jgi:hypothetical protein